MSFTAYWNGDWIPLDQMRIDPLDRGFTVADATFEATRTFGGKMFRLNGHIERLYRSLQYIQLDPGLTADEMANLTEQAVERNAHLLSEVGDLHIHHFVTRGRGQYEQIAQAVQENPQIRARVAQMEQSYDSVEIPADLSNGVSLPEGMETFLREAGKKLDED